MGVTIYEYPDWDANRRYTEDKYLGVHTGMPCYPTWDNCPQGGWGENVASVKIDPEGAFEWCGWELKNQGGYKDCYITSQRKNNRVKSYSSRSVKKVCSHPSNIWDGECNKLTPESTMYVGNCNLNSTCWNLQKETCRNANLATETHCWRWCKNNQSECPTAIYNYCNGLPIDTMVNDSICSQVKTNIIKDKCTTRSELFNKAACKNFCQNKPTECTASAQNYCRTTFDQTCKDFCVNDNIEICKSAIKNYCKGNNIKSEPFCQTTLIHPLMRGQHDLEMNRYCNAEGKNNLNNIPSSNIKDASEMQDNLTNPICACFDNQLINKKFDYVKNPLLKTQYTANPQCWYYNCMRGTGVYQKDNTDCKVKICNLQFDEVDIKNSSNFKIQNNCGDTGLTTAPLNTDGSQSSEPVSANKTDCQMSEWTACSKKCSDGLQTREKILEPLNGGKPCGPQVQICKIPCTSLKEQLQNSSFNFYDLDKTNKILFIVIVGIIIMIINIKI
jgi:hypothetical protein